MKSTNILLLFLAIFTGQKTFSGVLFSRGEQNFNLGQIPQQQTASPSDRDHLKQKLDMAKARAREQISKQTQRIKLVPAGTSGTKR